jgi:hypothetical protein
VNREKNRRGIVARRGRPPVLDATKREVILGILSAGCSRRTAANYVGCATSTIQNTADRDPQFAAKLDRAENQAVVTHMTNIHKAAKDARYWRAAAWVLERLRPDEYAAPHPDLLTVEQTLGLMEYLAQVIIEEVPVSSIRKNIIKRLDELNKMVIAMAPGGRAVKAERVPAEDVPRIANSGDVAQSACCQAEPGEQDLGEAEPGATKGGD